MPLHLSLPTPAGDILAAAASTTAIPLPDEEEYYSSWSLFLVCVLLILSLWTSYYLQIKKIRAVHETLVSIFAGMAVGLIVRIAPGSIIRDMLTFKHTLFFNLLLPPIILNSGYELKQENFFRNFGSILTFAFFGTFISAVGVGILVYIYSFLGLEHLEFTLLECLTFGSTLSATDPVTILAIFNQYKVDPKLYTVIFGESLLNDAVSIVMYETLSHFHGTEVYLSSIFHGIGIFLLSFSVSMALGVAFGLAISLVLKHSSLALYPSLESCLVALTAYTCYFFSNGLHMSGIVSLLFCGITMKHYAYHTMSRRTQRASKYLFSTLAQLSENFIFIYLGLSLFTSAPVSEPVTSYVKPVFIIITTVAVVFTRYAAVFPLSEAINFVHRHAKGQRTEELPHSYQMMLFWAGLRGAVGVALAAGFKGPNAQVMRTTVLIVVVLTVLIFGGTTARMLEVLGIKTGVEDDEGGSSDDEGVGIGSAAWTRRGSRNGNGGRWRYEDDESSAIPPNRFSRGPRRIGTHYSNPNPSSYNHHSTSQNTRQRDSPTGAIFSAASSDSYDSDGEVLPLAPTAQDTRNHRPTNSISRSASSPNVHSSSSHQEPMSPSHPPKPNTPTSSTASIGEEGKWFQALDERYLLPLFSNATASRTFHARRAERRTSGVLVASPGESEDEEGQELELGMGPVASRMQDVRDASRTERGLASPILRSPSAGGEGR
ncbi:Sodium/hydrogen exchanger family-domain-containing protein [Crucibulum laeve]|uniref:Sodium/hydrogen exchanger n=1 Tax=Crucibulum laeve TaxID=68775 RepID=A0A5C3LW33_9AGAR|nr:Sodium/hydrogen exchanger family-domain-containing protein [Crucibulum laeve]